MQINITEWRRSVACLAFHIAYLNQNFNLLGESSSLRGEYLFTDTGVPQPRACTALAWASLCAFGPVNGYMDSIGIRQNYTPWSGRFLLPFLPKIRATEDTSQSLQRGSKAHEKDLHGRIRWGVVYIGDAATGGIIEQLSHGARNAKEWADAKPRGFIHPHWEEQHEVPPLFAAAGEGWQFGIIQNKPNLAMTLRDPMIELARSGIGELSYVPRNCPQIRRLLMRFLDVIAARQWAEAYCNSMHSLQDSSNAREDLQLMVEQIREARRVGEKKAEKATKSGFNASALDVSDIQRLMAEL